MIFTEMQLSGAFLIEPEPLEDERGFFARTFCRQEFEAHGIDGRVLQCNLSYNHRLGTLRGMHWQAAPHEEGKLIRCCRGSAFDVIIDLRRSSPTYIHWQGITLSAERRNSIQNTLYRADKRQCGPWRQLKVWQLQP